MRRVLFFLNLLFFTAFCFTQQNSNFRVIGRIPDAGDSRTYQIQVGAFERYQNAQSLFERLYNASLSPAYEIFSGFTRVVINGVAARDVPSYLQRIQNMGFIEVIVRVDPRGLAVTQTPFSTAAVPSSTLSEIGYRIIREGETVNLAGIAQNRNVSSWISSTPSVVSVNSTGGATGVNTGSAFIRINADEYISVVVVPQENYYVVPESHVALLPQKSNIGEYTILNITEYRTEPTFRLSYRFNNKGENKGASGINGGIDIIARGQNYHWLWTTFLQGGWFYDLNGVRRGMVNGFQKDANNGVELTIRPEFIYDRGAPYLQLTHRLYNPNRFPVSGQKFGASADVMMHLNDTASLIHTPYGVHMTDSRDNPSLELVFICEAGNGITPVDTLWLGTYEEGRHLNYIYTDRRVDVHGEDSAIGFSYQNIDLAAGEAKEFTVRFTLARNVD